MSGPVYDDPIAHPGGTYTLKSWACPRCGKQYPPTTHRWPIMDAVNGWLSICPNCYEKDGIVGRDPSGLWVAEEKPDPVISPPHYTAGGIETIDYIKAKLNPDEFRGYLKGSIIKYLSRANLKGSEEQDYRKAKFYSVMLAGEDPRKEAE